MNREYLYRNIAAACGLILIAGLFISFSDPETKEAFDSFENLITLFAFIFTYLWQRTKLYFIGLSIYAISFNIEIYLSPLINPENSNNFKSTLQIIGIIGFALAVAIILIGFSNKFKNKYLEQEVKIGLLSTLLIVASFTLVAQILLRLI